VLAAFLRALTGQILFGGAGREGIGVGVLRTALPGCSTFSAFRRLKDGAKVLCAHTKMPYFVFLAGTD